MIEYFSHDYNARNDLNLKKLLMGEGLSGIGLYWCLVEMLYENDGYINLEDIPTIAFDLRTSVLKINNLINKYNLFCKNDFQFFSNSVLERMNARNEKSEKAKKSAEERWKKEENANAMRTQCERNTNAMRVKSECNAIKEKESKENKSKLKENKYIESKQVSNIKKEEINIHTHESYEELLDEFSVKGEYRKAMFRFIAHLKVSFGIVMLNERLENLIVKLDLKFKNDIDKINAIDDAIIKGFKRLDLECE